MTAAAAASATSPASAVPFLRLAGLRKTYPGVVALADFSLDVRPGEIIGVVGENGAGKSTLMSILYGFYHADSGEIRVDGSVQHITDSRHALRLGIGISHSRPYHPQTLGKDERFHRTLKAEVLGGPPFADLERCQQAFDRWRQVYNMERPHQALGMEVPATRYAVSPRPFPEQLPALEYGPEHKVRRVQQGGWISFLGRNIRLPKAFAGLAVGLVPRDDGQWTVIFATHPIAHINLRDGSVQPVTHVPEQV